MLFWSIFCSTLSFSSSLRKMAWQGWDEDIPIPIVSVVKNATMAFIYNTTDNVYSFPYALHKYLLSSTMGPPEWLLENSAISTLEIVYFNDKKIIDRTSPIKCLRVNLLFDDFSFVSNFVDLRIEIFISISKLEESYLKFLLTLYCRV